MRKLILVCILEIALLWLSPMVISQSEPQLTYRGWQCLANDNVTDNIVSVMSHLTSLSSSSKFDHFSTGKGRTRVSGVFLCRPDLPQDTCRACVGKLANLIDFNCLGHEGIIWYEECMVRYSNQTLFGAPEETEPYKLDYVLRNVTQVEYSGLLNRTLESLIADAAAPNNTLRYATRNVSFMPFEGVYALALCTPDLTALQCEQCLKVAFERIPGCCRDPVPFWSMVFLPSCQLRYDVAPFIISPPS